MILITITAITTATTTITTKSNNTTDDSEDDSSVDHCRNVKILGVTQYNSMKTGILFTAFQNIGKHLFLSV